MGKGKGRKTQKKETQNPKRQKRDKDFSDEDMDDEIDAFHKQRDIVPLDVDGDVGASDDDNEQPVFDVEVSDEEVDNDDDDFDDTEFTGSAAKMARQYKWVRQTIGGVEDEMDDDAEEEEKKAIWGRAMGAYYNADNVELSDEEALAEEEELVLATRQENAKSLTEQDFGIEDSDQDGSASDRERSLEDVLPKTRARSKPHGDTDFEDDKGAAYEEVKKDLNALSREEQMDVVTDSVPELVGLLSELNDALDQLETKVNPLLSKVKERNDTTKEGIRRYLEVKQLLLLAYCQAISFYLLLKSEGHPVRDHPVISRLVEIKSLLNKVKQLDDSLPSEIEEILDQHQGTESRAELDKEVLLSDSRRTINEPFSVSTKMLDAALPLETAELMKVHLPKDHVNKQEKHQRQNDLVGVQSMEMLKLRSSLEEKLKQKGSFSTSANKSDRTQKHLLQAVNRQLETRDDFADEVIDEEGGINGHASSSKLSQLVRTKLNKPKVISGDDDLPKRDDIGERRRKHELRVLATAGVKSTEEIGDEDYNDDLRGMGVKSMDADVEDGETEESEDEFYRQVKQQRAAKLSAKAELYSRKPVVPSSAETEAVDGKRHISYQMEKNRGLTRARKKLIKNPRKKYKLKHEKALKRRQGQVRSIKKPSGPYGGEVSGINAGISRSVRFKN